MSKKRSTAGSRASSGKRPRNSEENASQEALDAAADDAAAEQELVPDISGSGSKDADGAASRGRTLPQELVQRRLNKAVGTKGRLSAANEELEREVATLREQIKERDAPKVIH